MYEQDMIAVVEESGTYRCELYEASKAGVWHYIKTFLTFFSFISAAGLLMLELYPHSAFESVFLGMMAAGALCTIVTGIKNIFVLLHSVAAFLGKIGGAISFFTFIPFLWLFVMVIIYGGVFITGIGLVLFFPYVMSLITYIKDVRLEITDRKKEIIIAACGFLCAVAALGTAFAVHKTVSYIQAPIIESKLDVQTEFDEYVTVCEYTYVPEFDITTPVESTFDADSRSRVDTYRFTDLSDGVTMDYNMTISYRYGDGEWYVYDLSMEPVEESFTMNVSGEYKGECGYNYGLCLGNYDYILNIESLTEDGGRGTLSIMTSEGEYLENVGCTIEFSEVKTDKEGEGATVCMTVVYDEPLKEGAGSHYCEFTPYNKTMTLFNAYVTDPALLTKN